MTTQYQKLATTASTGAGEKSGTMALTPEVSDALNQLVRPGSLR